MTTIVNQLQDQFPFSVSTDNAGLFGNPKNAVSFWETVTTQLTGHSVPFGLELLAWRHLPIATVLNMPEIKQRFAGCHGRIGTRIDIEGTKLQRTLLKKKIALYNSVLHKSVSLLHTMATSTEDWEQKPYLLLHEPEVEMLVLTNSLTGVPRAIPIGVENSIDDPKLERTRLAVSQLEALGFEAVPVFDLAHFLTCHSSLSKPATIWGDVLAQFNEQMMVHLPIGFNVSDSLDYKQTNNGMLHELASAIKDSRSYCTLEFQLSGVWPLYAQPTYLPYVTKYASEWLERLLATKVICAK